MQTQRPKCVLMIGPNLSHRVTRSAAVAMTCGIHATRAFRFPFDRSSGFFSACSAMVDNASTTSCLLVSEILLEEFPDCTLVAPASKRLNEWLTRDYTEIHTGDVVKLGSKYRDKTLTPQTISHTIWKHFLHPEDKSLGPDSEACNEYTRGLLKRRPVVAMLPFEYIGKEIERRAPEGEDVAVLEGDGPIRYGDGRQGKTRSAAPLLIQKARRYGLRLLVRASGTSQHATERFLRGERVHPATRKRLADAVANLEQDRAK